MLCMLANLVMYVVFLLMVYKKQGGMSLNAWLILFIAFIALFGFCIYDTEYYNWGYYNWCLDHTRNKMSFSPLLFLFCGFLLYYVSFAHVNTNEISRIGTIHPWAENILYYGNVLFLVLFLFTFRNAVGHTASYADAYSSGFNGERYGMFGKYAFSLGTPLILIQVILPFYLFIKNTKKNYVKGGILLLLTMGMFYMKGALLGSRGVLFFGVVYMVYMYLFLKGYMTKKANKVIAIVGLSMLGLFLSLAIAISFDRFGEKMFYSIASYFGESFINFALIYWNYPKFLGGDLLLMQFLGLPAPYIPVWVGYFRPMAGAVYIDFGVWGALLFFFIYAVLWKKILGHPRKSMTMSQMYVYVFLFQGFIYGAFSFEVYNIKSYIVMFVVYLFLRLAKNKRVCEKNVV